MLLEDEAEDGGEEVSDADDERAVGRVDRAPRLLEDQLREERHRSLQCNQIQLGVVSLGHLIGNCIGVRYIK